ncbi:hypothetical protein [Cupriavidus basilensis]
MKRRIACVNDELEDGGRILPSPGRGCTFGDPARQTAMIGGQAYCEACKSTGTIAKAGGPRRMQFMGEIALDGDIVLCRCPMPPRIVALLAGEKWFDDMGARNGAPAAISPAQSIFAASNPQYDQQIQLINEQTGQPLARVRYRLIGERGTFDGRTDEQGMSERVASDTASTMKIEILGAGRLMRPIKTVKVQHTPIEDRAPVKVYLLRPRGTLYWGGAGLDGGYVQPLLDAFRKAGIAHCFAGLTHTASAAMPNGDEFAGTLLDAIHSGMLVRSRDDSEWTIAGGMAMEAPQFNLIGYSYGSLLAAQTAWSYARAGHVIDHLVLVGSPIEAGFLSHLRNHENIRKTIVIDLKPFGDPIYAGMPWRELVESVPMLERQMLAGKCEGHFYYAHVVRDSPKRWAALAERVAAEGLR